MATAAVFSGQPTRVPTPTVAGRSKTGTPTPDSSSGRPRLVARRITSAQALPDYLSDQATTSFIRRVLCPDLGVSGGGSGGGAKKGSSHQRGPSLGGGATPTTIEDVLPPLTSRNDVDLQLYALVAVVVREYVQSWYGRITPDETFVAEVVQIIAHCTRALEQRLRKVDLEDLLLNELPLIFEQHVVG